MTVEETVEKKLTDIIDVVRFCQEEELPAEVVGQWVWIEFDGKPSEEIRTKLKAVGFKWIKKRGKWAHNCGVHSRRGRINPRVKYGFTPVSNIREDDLK